MPQPWAAKSHNDLLPQPDLLGMSGLEFMQGIQNGALAGPPICDTLNFFVSVVEKGKVAFDGQPLFSAFNPMGSVHGGWYGTLLDSCMACAVMTMLPKGSYYVTQEFKINIVRAIPEKAAVRATGVVSHVGRSTGVATGEIRGTTDNKLYAIGSTTCLIMNAN